MRESRERGLAVEDRRGAGLVERAFEAAVEGPREERIRKGLEIAIGAAETDPEAARAALWVLRGDPVTLERVERTLGGSAERATLAVGAAIQLASAELSSPAPDLRGRAPELLRWLEDDWC